MLGLSTFIVGCNESLTNKEGAKHALNIARGFERSRIIEEKGWKGYYLGLDKEIQKAKRDGKGKAYIEILERERQRYHRILEDRRKYERENRRKIPEWF